MTQKPGIVEAIAAVAIGYAVGAALALPVHEDRGPVETAAAVDPRLNRGS